MAATFLKGFKGVNKVICIETFFGWFYDCPDRWADADVLDRFAKSCRAYSDYIDRLEGPTGRLLKSVASEWIVGPQAGGVRGAEITRVSVGPVDSEMDLGEVTVELLSRAGRKVVFEYGSIIEINVSTFDEVLSRELIDGHEILVGRSDGIDCLVHFIYFAGRSPWVVAARNLRIFGEEDNDSKIHEL